MASPKDELFTISVVSKMFTIHPQTLRLYEREGLLRPRRSRGNTRLYSREDVDRISKILNLTRDLGVNLAGVEVIFSIQQKMEDMREFVWETLGYLDQEIRSYFEERLQKNNYTLMKAPPNKIVKVELDK
jgi:MerR family transcriptional regulator, heat shock protein HspR